MPESLKTLLSPPEIDLDNTNISPDLFVHICLNSLKEACSATPKFNPSAPDPEKWKTLLIPGTNVFILKLPLSATNIVPEEFIAILHGLLKRAEIPTMSPGVPSPAIVNTLLPLTICLIEWLPLSQT